VTGRGIARAAAAVLAAAALTIGSASCSPGPTTHTVTIDATRFQPADLRVRVGDTVIWVNKDLFPHTATAGGVFDSGSIAPDRSWQYTVTASGVTDYDCTFHPTMKGRLLAE